MFADIPASNSWKSIEKVEKGWSSDEKYQVLTADGTRLLLRLSVISELEDKRREYEIIQKFASIGFEMSRPVVFGTCADGTKTYMLLTWVEGQDLESALPRLPEAEQYALGRKAGRILRSIHELPLPAEVIPMETKLAKKERQLRRYLNSSLRLPEDQPAVDFFERHKDLIWKQPPTYLHGDFHPGNMILTPSGELGIIDFNRWEIGDPYEEFYKLESFGTESSIPYCIGQIDAYFDDAIPEEFWKTMAVYVAHASLFSIVWAEKFGQKDIDEMVLRCRRALEDYDNFQQSLPKWYKREMWKGS
jgi:aminoglycoside phosphotransferase (APT) family kinase protein